MKVAIVGSRRFRAMDTVRAFVRQLPPGTIVVSGAGEERRAYLPEGAYGVDETAEDEAIKCGLVVVSYPAQWKRPDGTVDRGAGFKRNGLIAAQADRVVAFWDGQSHGTKDTIKKARKLDKPVEIILWVEGIGIVVGV